MKHIVISYNSKNRDKIERMSNGAFCNNSSKLILLISPYVLVGNSSALFILKESRGSWKNEQPPDVHVGRGESHME